MAETTAPLDTRARRGGAALGGVAAWTLTGALALIVAAELVFFGIHAADLLRYPYPLDYGEGPLLAQVNLLRAGTPVWRLYGDPGAPPYAVVNYPPVYLLLAALAAIPVGDTLLAGRALSLIAALTAVVALWALSDERPTGGTVRPSSSIRRLLIVLAFLGLPIIREWAVLARVDMLGLSLGLWGLVIVQRNLGRRRVLWAALPLALGLLVKPSLIAAPAAALLWLLFRDWRRALLLGLLLAAVGGLGVALIQAASGGWFAVHILAANANDWQFKLAHTFWHDQLVILWPLLAAAALGFLARRPTTDDRRPTTDDQFGTQHAARSTQHAAHSMILLPLYYTLFGAIVAFGVGKVGAYANYFLEYYAGLIWLAASAFRPTTDDRSTTNDQRPTTGQSKIEDRGWRMAILHPLSSILNRWFSVLVLLFVIGALLRYYPMWSEQYLKLAGIIEKTNPPRVAFGQYGVWRDLARERAILATLNAVNSALAAEIQAAGAPIFTDVPGVAAQAGQIARLQAFEHRQLLDAGRWDQRPLLRDLANGRVPLVVLDYLGNWLTPEMIALITHRYAQDGSRGTYDLYRPVAPGPLAAADLRFPGGPRLVGYHLALSAGRPLYQAGETLLLTLDWQRDSQDRSDAEQAGYAVVVQLTDGQGHTLLETTRPLLYGALPPADWGGDVMQHLQPLALPPELPAMSYTIAITLRASGRDLAPPRVIAPIVVAEQGGRILGEPGYFVPAPLREAWQQAGGYDGPGDPLMPAAPFYGYTLQCFARACLRLDGDGAHRLPLGELVHLGDVGLKDAPAVDGVEERSSETGQNLRGPFLDYWRANGGMTAFGSPISGELVRGDQIVQYTRYARLERPIAGGAVRLGRLGEEFLRLPGGVAYRWP